MIAPTTDGDVSNTVVFACYNDARPACLEISNGAFTDGYSSAALVSPSGSTGTYSVDNLQTGQYSLIAAKDSNGDEQANAGDYVGIYFATGATTPSLVTPPQTGLTIQLFDVANLPDAKIPNSATAEALRKVSELMSR